tara:strand:+ start:1562 stop:2038 length:477 start_codon:yes stop_codon:yes gene_type:complete
MSYNSFATERNMLIDTLAFLRERFSTESNRTERGIIGRQISSVEDRLEVVNRVMDNYDSPPYAPDSPPYAPDSPPYVPGSPQYAPDSPTGSVRSIVDVDPTPPGSPNRTPPRRSSPQVPSAPTRSRRSRRGGTKKRKGKKRKTMKKKSAKKGKKTKKR